MKKTLLLLTAALSLGSSPALAFGVPAPSRPVPPQKAAEDARWFSPARNIVVVKRDAWGKPIEVKGDARVTEYDAQGRAIAAEINGVRKVCVTSSIPCSLSLQSDVHRSLQEATMKAAGDWELNTAQGRAYRNERLSAFERYQDSRARAIGRCTSAGYYKQADVVACTNAQGYRY